jgi:hypothetical protein
VRAVDRARVVGRLGESGVGRDGRLGRYGFPRHPLQDGDLFGERRQRADHSARRRLSRAALHRARQTQAERTRLERNITVDRLIAAAQRIFRPYTFDVKEVAWWSVYEIGQRLCDKFDDVPEAEVGRRRPRVFIAGDACHTHSPKAGQGMNVSIADAFNLGWKLAAVLRGTSSPQLLHTYSDERQTIAKELIEFDRAFAQVDQHAAEGSGESGCRRHRSGGIPAQPSSRRAASRRVPRSLRSVADHGRADVPAPRARLRNRDALPLGAGHSLLGRKARPPRAHDQGGRAMEAVRLRRLGRSRFAALAHLPGSASFSPSRRIRRFANTRRRMPISTR